MADIDTTVEKEVMPAEIADVVEAVDVAAPVDADKAARPADRERKGRSDRRGGRPSSNRARPERKSEFDQKMINIRRVARVVAGGRRFSFSVSIIIGDKKGRVGVGVGKAGDTTLAIDKAVRDAKKNMITVKLTKDNSIAHDISAKYCASRIAMSPAHGRGLVAGSSVRLVLELAGITNIVAKVQSGSKNGLNNARAAVEALTTLKV